ncbi:hypothetical protein GCM10007276_09970 [Agaricicola taiwanensis]|uniref:SCP2 domain-containing protein n=1 Tax=Agaricicola taiwanensis TaxID=591372 RepID=A0A8J2YBV0_9RHOB|nr:hypothetical protein [Agaricicola taiwanensis]GGE34555.1 hypothetical protein GCM10007276_09970 [Agaricicola taiwanensis]
MSIEGALRTFMADAVNASPPLVQRGTLLNTVFLMGIGDESFYVTVRDGRIESIETREKPLQAVSFSVKGGIDAWNDFWQPVPKPGSYDILGLAKVKRMTIEGDIKVLMTHLRYIKEVLAAPRGKMGALHG